MILIQFLMACNSNPTKMGQMALEQHDLQQAEQWFRQAIQAEPSDVKALEGLGWTYHLALEKDRAMDLFAQCLNVQPKNVDCMRGRASVAMSQGDMVLAKTWIEVALQESSSDPEVRSTQALLLMNQDGLPKAKSILEKLVNEHPNNGKYYLPYAEVLLRSAQIQQAQETVEKGLSLKNTPIRYVAMLWLMRSRILLEGSSKMEEDCTQREAVLLWLKEAERSIAEVEGTGVAVPNLAIIKRQVFRRITSVQEACPIGK